MSISLTLLKEEVVIIGGGLSGLYAALQLEQRGIPYVILEAKDTFGGRIYGQACHLSENNINNNETTFHDLGPTWVFPHHKKMQALVTKLNETLFEQYTQGDVIYHANQHSTPQVVSSPHAYLLQKVKGGLYKLILSLVNQLPSERLKLNHKVSELSKFNDEWQVTVDDSQSITKRYHAKHVILALPPRLIHQYLTPELWASNALRQQLKLVPTWMSAQAKFLITYKQPFWREKNLSGQAFSRVGPLIEIHDASAEQNQYFALFGFIGYSADTLKALSKTQLETQCINQLRLLFGEQIDEYMACYVKNWSKDVFTATALDIQEPPCHPFFNLPSYQAELSQLSLSLVASEFAQHEAGYLEGALNAVDLAIEQL